jgi:hypothetical protein
VKVISNLYLVLGVFCLVSGIILGLWGHEVAGTFYLVVVSVAFAYLAKESREFGEEPADIEEPDVMPASAGSEAADDVPRAHDVAYHASAPSLTPFLFAIGAGLIVSGLVFAQWLVLVGGGVMAVVAVAWFIETGRRRAAEEAAKAGHGEHH